MSYILTLKDRLFKGRKLHYNGNSPPSPPVSDSARREVVSKLAKKTLVNKGELRQYSHYLIWGAVAAVALSALDFLGISFWLTATQWLVVAGVLAAFGIYARLGA